MSFVRVVNMIPAAQSGETNQDSEPNLAVNPERPTDMVATAFTFSPNPSLGLAPIYVSTDGGRTWSLNSIVPNGQITSDITVAFSTTGGMLYAAILPRGATVMQILRTPTFTGPTPMTVLFGRSREDQPWVVAGSVVINGRSVDRVYVGNRDERPRGGILSAVAAVDVSLDAANAPAPAGFRETALGIRRGRFSLPPTRIAIHPDGTIYTAFLHCTRVEGDGLNYNFDVVVRRDDNWGDNADPFSALAEPNKTLGMRAGSGFCRFNDVVGQERVGADLAIAVDPTDSSTVYVAFCSRTGGVSGTDWALLVIRSDDRGNNWGAVRDIRPIAKNPALAINAEGLVGLASQQLTEGKWVSRLELTRNGWATPPETKVLHQAPSNVPARMGLPYIGDYIRLLAVGNDFYGVFSGNNTPDIANFPNGVFYQRLADFTNRVLLNTDGITPVAISIDPFFFHWSRVKPPETKAGRMKAEIDTPPKSIKAETKEIAKVEVDTPPKSIKAETKELVETKPAITKAESDLPPEGIKHGPTEASRGSPDALTSLVLKLNQRLEVLEKQVAQGRSFIRPAERPDTGPAGEDVDEDEKRPVR